MRNEKVLYLVLNTAIFIEAIKLTQVMYLISLSGFNPETSLTLSEVIIFIISVALLIVSFKMNKFIIAALFGMNNLLIIYSGIYQYNHFALTTLVLLILGLKPLLFLIFKDKFKVNQIISYLLVVNVSIVYFFSAIAKINPDFLDGSILIEIIHPFLVLPNSIEPLPWIYITLSVLVICLELLLSIQFIFKQKFLRVVQSAGFILHAGMALTLNLGLYNFIGLILFMLVTVCVYPLMISDNWGDDKWLVFWDYDCIFCARTIKLAAKFDNFAMFDFRENTNLQEFKNLPFNAALSDESIILYNEITGEFLTASKAMFFLFTNNFFFWPILGIIESKTFVKVADLFYFRIAKRRKCSLK